MACGLGLVALLCGCLNASTVVFVNKDGSGTVTETVLVRDMVAVWTSTNHASATLAEHKNRCRAKVPAMGRDVGLSSVEELRTNGMSGFKAVYTFRDVRNLAIDQRPDVSLLGDLAPTQTVNRLPITFGFAGTDTPTLIVNIPKPGTDSDALPQSPNVPVPKDLTRERNATIRSLLTDFRIQLKVRVEGTIARTKAAHVELKNNTVVLLDLDIAKPAKNDRQLERLIAMGRLDDIDTAKRRLSGMPDIKIETAERIEIQFR